MRITPLFIALAALALASGAVPSGPARADIVVDVNQGVMAPLPIAIPNINGSPVGAQISQVVAADLERSGLFRSLDQGSFRQRRLDVNIVPDFTQWKAIGAQALLVGQVANGADGRLSVDFRLWDNYSGDQLLGETFTSTPENWRRVAHKISDAIYEKLTGVKGYFDTRVVFVAESGPKTARIRRLMIMDQDGANRSYIDVGAPMVFTPRFSSTSQEITFMALRPTGASIYILNLETGRQEPLGHYPGMVFAPRFSPDGRKVAFSVEKNGNSDIYLMDLSNHSTVRLTTDPGIDTSPSFSPGGGQIVFNSDRGGEPQLYVMNSDGTGAHRISYGSGRYTTPVWSPDGRYVAFTKQEGGAFHIGVMSPDGSNERILTTSYLDEGPTWAPNGRMIMFSRETASGGARLWTVDLTGHIEKAADYPQNASDPAWSPPLN